jgi:hypothetical protein
MTRLGRTGPASTGDRPFRLQAELREPVQAIPPDLSTSSALWTRRHVPQCGGTSARAAVRRHLGTCLLCQAEYQDLVPAVGWLTRLGPRSAQQFRREHPESE